MALWINCLWQKKNNYNGNSIRSQLLNKTFLCYRTTKNAIGDLDMFSLEIWILLLGSIIVLYCFIKYLDYKRNYILCILFVLITGLFNTWISHILVLTGYLEFPWRLFPHATLNNIIYDLIDLPLFLLLLFTFCTKKKRYVLCCLFFTGFVTIKDFLLIKYTSLLSFHKWTLIHTFISSIVIYVVYLELFMWLKKLNKR